MSCFQFVTKVPTCRYVGLLRELIEYAFSSFSQRKSALEPAWLLAVGPLA